MTIETTIQAILDAGTWTQRIQQIRLIPQRHGTEHHGTIYAAVARDLFHFGGHGHDQCGLAGSAEGERIGREGTPMVDDA